MKTSLALLFLSPLLAAAQSAPAQVEVSVRDFAPTTLTLHDLKRLPRQTVKVKNPKTKTKETYEGALLSDVLAQAHAPMGKTLHGRELLDYVVVTASDDYHVIFSLAELDPPTHANRVLLADTMDGKALESPQGPLKLIAPEDLRPERWVRMVTKINIRRAP
jgi:hypothetical protein